MAQQQHPVCFANNSLQQQQLSCAALSIPQHGHGSSAGGSLTFPGNSCSSSGTLLASPHCSPAVTTAACEQQQDMGIMMAAVGGYSTNREWLYRLFTFPAYFTPCVSCCGGSRAPKREQLMTLFDTLSPYQVYCSHCPEVKKRGNDGTLLQVRRSAFKDVVKATDVARFGCDVAGVQQYTLNGSKVIYLNREQAPERKGSGASSAPAQCSVDGRAMMDKSSQYCSLKCKMHAEDPGFGTWLDSQDPSVRILAQAAANAPPRPTVACKRANPCSSACSSEDASAATDASASAVSSGSRPAKKPARTGSGSVSSGDAAAAAAAAVPAAVTMDMPVYGMPAMPMAMGSRVMVAPPGCGSYMQPHEHQQQQQMMPAMQRSASACLPGSSTAAAAAAPSGLRRVKISLAGQKRQASAPSAFSLEAALSDPLLQPAAAGMVCGKDCMLPCCNEDMFSLSGNWDSALDSALSSPSQLAGLEDLEDLEAWASSGCDDDGCASPALINAPRSAFGSATSSACEWWLPAAGPFAAAGMGALVMGSAEGSDGGVLGGDAEDDGELLLPGSSGGYECCDMVMSMMAAESLSGAALMLH
jgi:hypothetical protein